MMKKNKQIYTTYYFWGILFLTTGIAGLLSGRTVAAFAHELWPIGFCRRQQAPLYYYFTISIYILYGLFLLYRSLLFMPSNREYRIKKDGFDRRFVKLEKEIEPINLPRIFFVTVATTLIIFMVYYVHMVL